MDIRKKKKWSAIAIYSDGGGGTFDIDHPVLFTEKIIWYKLYYDRSDFVDIVDKYLFKEYIHKQIGEGYTIQLYGAWTSIAGLQKDWHSLPDEFVLKSTLQSDGKFIKIVRKKSDIDFDNLSNEIKEWLVPENTLINSFCRAYYKAKPRIIAEKYMSQIDDQLYDYKIFCFDGKPFCFYAAMDHFADDEYPIVFYDLEWNKLDVKYGRHRNDVNIEPPKFLNEMIHYAKILSKGFPFIRVDYFTTSEALYLAELTLYPGGGLVPYYPESFNRRMGDLFVLPSKVEVK